MATFNPIGRSLPAFSQPHLETFSFRRAALVSALFISAVTAQSSPFWCTVVGSSLSKKAVFIPDFSSNPLSTLRDFFFNQTQQGLTLKNLDTLSSMCQTSINNVFGTAWAYGFAMNPDFINQQLSEIICPHVPETSDETGDQCSIEQSKKIERDFEIDIINCSNVFDPTPPPLVPEERYLLRYLFNKTKEIISSREICTSINYQICETLDCRQCESEVTQCSCSLPNSKNDVYFLSQKVNDLPQENIAQTNCGDFIYDPPHLENIFFPNQTEFKNLFYLKYLSLIELITIAQTINNLIEQRGVYAKIKFSLWERDHFLELFEKIRQEYNNRPVKCEYTLCYPDNHHDLDLENRNSVCYQETILPFGTLTRTRKRKITATATNSESPSKSTSFESQNSESPSKSLSFESTQSKTASISLPPPPQKCCSTNYADCMYRCLYPMNVCQANPRMGC